MARPQPPHCRRPTNVTCAITLGIHTVTRAANTAKEAAASRRPCACPAAGAGVWAADRPLGPPSSCAFSIFSPLSASSVTSGLRGPFSRVPRGRRCQPSRGRRAPVVPPLPQPRVQSAVACASRSAALTPPTRLGPATPPGSAFSGALPVGHPRSWSWGSGAVTSRESQRAGGEPATQPPPPPLSPFLPPRSHPGSHFAAPLTSCCPGPVPLFVFCSSSPLRLRF